MAAGCRIAAMLLMSVQTRNPKKVNYEFGPSRQADLSDSDYQLSQCQRSRFMKNAGSYSGQLAAGLFYFLDRQKTAIEVVQSPHKPAARETVSVCGLESVSGLLKHKLNNTATRF